MEDRELRDEISDLEERVQALAVSAQSCRKLIFVAKMSMLTGGMLMMAAILGLLTFDPLAMIVATTAIIGGIVVFGSTTTSAKQISAAMKDAELLKSELIGRIPLRVVGERVNGQDQS
ncbi:MAG TPA: hypothetical protein VF913_12955 [Xanthobacteraceae bacterium]